MTASKQIPPEEVPPTGSKSKPNDGALEALEKAMGSETKEKFAVRYEERYDLEMNKLYVVWSKLKALLIKDSEKGDEKSVEPLQKDSMAKGRVKASGEKKLEQRNIHVDKEQTSQKKVVKERKNTQKGVEPGSQSLKDILTYPKPVIQKKGLQIFLLISQVSK